MIAADSRSLVIRRSDDAVMEAPCSAKFLNGFTKVRALVSRPQLPPQRLGGGEGIGNDGFLPLELAQPQTFAGAFAREAQHAAVAA